MSSARQSRATLDAIRFSRAQAVLDEVDLLKLGGSVRRRDGFSLALRHHLVERQDHLAVGESYRAEASLASRDSNPATC